MKTIASMTGFARSGGQRPEMGLSWTWEARSVNGKGLDVRVRWPNGFDALEAPAKELVARHLTRGSVTVSLQTRTDAAAGGGQVRINQALLAQLMDLARDLPLHVQPPSFDGLLQVRGVLETVEAEEPDDEARKALETEMLASLDQALTGLKAARHEEGARLNTILRAHLATIADLVSRAGQTASARPDAMQDRLRAALSQLLEAKVPVSEDRLAQELALIATRQDVREELDRLVAHIAQAMELLDAGGPVGRRLDFLCQEFNREANTLCSKAQDTALTRIGLELKTVIDQLREQVQNVE
ncbi:YicC/YloC family endoribonuclease [Novispirillum itersonii]|uniref:YicC/YloC family endoribonuclease n=1 Tax=Novispirillum itersonii TaxID=189 RepID=UPI00035D6319|nr:YicC/YloC family endoribonuclease [Novispirillum itersonii]